MSSSFFSSTFSSLATFPSKSFFIPRKVTQLQTQSKNTEIEINKKWKIFEILIRHSLKKKWTTKNSFKKKKQKKKQKRNKKKQKKLQK